MNRITKKISMLAGGAALVMLAAGVLGFMLISQASAQTPTPTTPQTNLRPFDLGHGRPGLLGMNPAGDEFLANALGITTAELQTAEQKASDAAIQQAVDQGLITQEQADQMTLRGFGFFGPRGFDGFGKVGTTNGSTSSGIDYQALLAQALGISVDQLQTAQQNAEAARLAQAVADGTLTQEQADLIKARQALQSYLDPNTLFAEALGITTDQLQAYRDQGMNLTQILQAVGKTAVEVRDAEQAAYQAAVQKAVSDGVITQAQADQVLSGGFNLPGGWDGGPGFGGRGGHGRGGFGGFGGPGQFGNRGTAPNTAPNTTPNATPNTTPSTAPATSASIGL